MAIATYGTNAVDWEQRIDFDRLRSGRLARLRDHLEQSDLGALVAFDFSNIRYMSATYIGTCAVDKLIRFALITRYSDPIVWDVGSAARHHQLFNPWLSASTRAADVDADADPHAPHHGTPRPRLESGARAGSPPFDARSTPTPRSPKAWRRRSGANWTGWAWPVSPSGST